MSFLSKFLLLDAGIMLIGLPLIFFTLQSRQKNDIPSLKSPSNISKNETSINLPSKINLLEMEKVSRKMGSGINFDSLIGLWKFESVWQKNSKDKESMASLFLRIFSANLELAKDTSTNESMQFNIANSIQFGLLSIVFKGNGSLQGKQPLLTFFFKEIELKAGLKVIFKKSLKIPENGKRPFFALISMEENGQWLSARGRGSGLALWKKENAIAN
tara:strand:- start:168 stop:815 length:648 start_codon:yes stop_codon:yes gene_type:complete